jgi:hypothetical protein
LKEIKGFIQKAANVLHRVLPGSLSAPLIPDFTPTSATSSVNFKDIAVNYLNESVSTINDMFNSHIGKTIAELDSKFKSYDQSRQNLVDNIQHCTNDRNLLQDINNVEILGNYDSLVAKYKGYKEESSKLYKGITQDVDKIVDTGIDDDTQQKRTKDLFEMIKNKCTTFAEFVTDRMDKIRAEIADFEKSVANYLSTVVPGLTTRLIACINHSIRVAETEIDSGYGAIHYDIITEHFELGDKDIVEIPKLLDKLVQLEADSP